MIKPEMSPYCFFPNGRRLGDLLFAIASSICLRTQHKEQSFSQKTLSVDFLHADSGDSEHANHRTLCICCLQTPHSSHPVCAAALQRNIPFMAPPPWSRNTAPPLGWAKHRQHLVFLPSNWKWEGQMWVASKAHLSPPVCSGILTP